MLILNSLKNRLTLSLILIICLVGGAALWIGQKGMHLYYEELTQQMNKDIAMYITQEHQLLDTKLGTKATINQLAHQAMVINPMAEVYLLNPDGSINSHSQAEGSLKRTRVALEPILKFLDGEANFPLRGNDPRHLDTNKIFSVSEVRKGKQLHGYLYVILGGQRYDAIQDSIAWSHIKQQSAWSIAVLIAAALLIGVVLFHKLTQPLANLTRRMDQYAQRDAQPSSQSTAASGDEIVRLKITFEKMTRQLDQQIAQLHESDRLRRELTSNISHDLRTPLSTVQGYLETLLLKGDELDSTQRQGHLETAVKGCQRLGFMVADLFELSKLESGANQPVYEEFSLAELMHDTIQDFALEAQRKDISLKLENISSSTANTTICADIGLIQRVFENLIRNAINHTPAHGSIRLGFVTHSSSVEVTVADSGRGIDSEDLPFIFERFYQSSDTPKKQTASSGLGLAIVKRILDLHGCQIEVHSRTNQGSQFRFDLPVAHQSPLASH